MLFRVAHSFSLNLLISSCLVSFICWLFSFLLIYVFSEWLSNQHRDSLCSYMGHPPLLQYFSTVHNQSIGRTRYMMMQVSREVTRTNLHSLLFFLHDLDVFILTSLMKIENGHSQHLSIPLSVNVG